MGSNPTQGPSSRRCPSCQGSSLGLISSSREDGRALIQLIILASVGCAACWGTVDFLSRLPSGEIGSYQSTLMMNVLDFALLLSYVVLFDSGSLALLTAHPLQLLVNVAAGVCTFGALLSLFEGYVSGVMSVVSPIASAYPAVTIVLGFLLLGTPVTMGVALGIVTIFAGMFLAGVKVKELRKAAPVGSKLVKGLNYGILSFAMLGFVFFGLAVAAFTFGFILPILVMRGVSSVTGLALLKPTGRGFRVPGRRSLTVLLVMSALDSTAFVTYNLSFLSAAASLPLVVTISGQFAIFTIVLARTFYGEKLDTLQYLGIAVVLAGIAAVSI